MGTASYLLEGGGRGGSDWPEIIPTLLSGLVLAVGYTFLPRSF